MKITDVTLTLFAWESIPSTIYGHHTARPTGKSFTSDWGMVFGVRDGRATSFRVVEDTARLAAAFRR